MSTRHSQTQTERQPDRPTNRTRTTPAESAAITSDPRTATDRAPRTFSYRSRGRLENLIDEFNAAFADNRPSGS